MSQDVKMTENNPTDEDKLLEEDIAKMFGSGISRQELFDRFLTYRRRLARLGAVQALYLYDVKCRNNDIVGENLFGNNCLQTCVSMLCEDVISFYKSVFFTPKEYGLTKKNKKLDEDFMFSLVSTAIANMQAIDKYIQYRLSGNWTVEKLDLVLKAIIRCAVSEALLGIPIEKPILCSEYTNVASNFFSSKEIGFVNGIVDRLYGDVSGNKIYNAIRNIKS